MKNYSEYFNKKSRMIRSPEIEGGNQGRLAPLQPEHLQHRLTELLQVQNDYFPCFDWAFPPPLLSKRKPPSDAPTLFAQPSVTPGRYSVYLHSPFCKTLCSFCYYAVIPGRGVQHADTYVDYLVREMVLYRDSLSGQVCESVYFGGGTPTFLDDDLLVRVFTGLRDNFTIEPGAEITIEAAPGTLPRAKTALLRDLGVTRLSYGIQTLDEALLAGMNRHYSVPEAIRELEDAVQIIGNVNIDTMYGFDGEPEEALTSTLTAFHAIGIPSVSIYALDKQRNQAKDVQLPPKDLQYEHKIQQFARAETLLHKMGYRQVLQNVFVDPQRGSYRHQLRRWDNLPLVALGMNSQGYAPRRPYQNMISMKSYFEAIDAGRLPVATMDELDPAMELCRELTSKLRFTFVSRSELMYKYGVDVSRVFADLISALNGLGYIANDGDVMRMTPQAAYYNNVIPMLFAPDAFKELLLGLPEEYLQGFPVPYVMTQLGFAQSCPISFPASVPGERRALGRRQHGQRHRSMNGAAVQNQRATVNQRQANRRRADRYRPWLAGTQLTATPGAS